jgi:G3E family GTPase
MPPTPTNLFTGFLGVGKTTAILDLLGRKPAGGRWAVLVNEYGEVGIDQAVIEGAGPEGVTVREVGGGCFCCATAPYLPVALHFLLTDAKPDRLLIESSGLGHPARLLDTLRANYAGRLDLRATICLVDPNDFADPAMKSNPVFADQVQLADVVVLNKLDAAAPLLVADFRSWADGLFPPKLLVAGTTRGRLDPAWLDLTAAAERFPLFPDAHAEHHHRGEPVTRLPEPGRPVRYETAAGPRAACGWVFSPADVFDEDRLLRLLGSAPAGRLKGVFRLEGEWAAVNRVGGAVTVAPTAYRRGSRVEVFAGDARPDWDGFERDLLACLAGKVTRPQV